MLRQTGSYRVQHFKLADVIITVARRLMEPAAVISPIEYMIEGNGSEVNDTPEYTLTIKSVGYRC